MKLVEPTSENSELALSTQRPESSSVSFGFDDVNVSHLELLFAVVATNDLE